MASFAVVILTAPPAGLAGDEGGAFVKIDGREALLRSVELFLNRDSIALVQLVVSTERAGDAKTRFGGNLAFMGVKFVQAGARWADQLAAAAQKLPPDVTHVLVHDAARPIVPYSDIDALMTEAQDHPAVALVSPVKSQLVEVDEGHNPLAIHLPTSYLHLLTPQAYTREKFAELAAGRSVHPSELTLVKGSPLNIRVGHAADATLAKAMIQMLPRAKSKVSNNPFEEAQW